MTQTPTPAGWYPDPEQAGQQRYWDGAQWTEHRAPLAPTYQPPSYPDPAQDAKQAYQAPGHSPGQAPGQPTYQQPGYGQAGYPQAAYGAYQPSSSSNTTRNVLIAIAVVFVLLVGGCFAVVGLAAKGVDDAVDSAVEQSKTAHEVTYRVAGTATSASVTYTDDSSSSTQDEIVDLPFEKTVTIEGSFFNFYSISASGEGEGSVTCEIVVDGKTVDTQDSGADFGFTICSGSETP